MQDAAVAKGNSITLNTDRAEANWVMADEMRITQVLLNLLSNAIKFTERGTIVAEIRQDQIDDDTVLCHYAVTDPGIDIPVNAQAKIFRSFEQADSSTTRQYGGTGLGLAVSQDLIQKMGGLD